MKDKNSQRSFAYLEIELIFNCRVLSHPDVFWHKSRAALVWLPELINFAKRVAPMPDLLHNPRPSAGTSVNYQEDTDVLTDYESPYSLIVWNDEVNTFEWVIETLIDVCGQSQEQAEQCAMIIHTKGKYAVKRGSYEELKPLCDAITERGIGATIEILSES